MKRSEVHIPAEVVPPLPEVAPGYAPRRRLGWLVWLALAAAVVALRYRSHRTSDVAVFGTRAGCVQGVASHRGQLMLAVSTLSLGPERSLTIERDAMPCEAFDALYGQVYAWIDGRKDVAGFGFAQTQRGQGIGNAVHAVVLVPHWALAALLFLPAARLGWTALRERRRRKRGLCRACGYDLRGGGELSGGICPECGTYVSVQWAAASLPLGPVILRMAANVVVTVALGMAVLFSLGLTRLKPTPPNAGASEEEVAAGLYRRVPELTFRNATPAQVVQTLRILAGVRIDDPGHTLTSDFAAASEPINASIRDVSVSAALDVFLGNGYCSPLCHVVRDGSIVLGRLSSEDEPTTVVYDVSDIIDAIVKRDGPPAFFTTQQRNFAGEEVVHLVESLPGSQWRSQSFSSAGSLETRATYWNGRLTVVHNAFVQRRVSRLLDGLHAAMGEKSSPSKGVR